MSDQNPSDDSQPDSPSGAKGGVGNERRPLDELEFEHKPTPAAVSEFVSSRHATQRENIGDEISKGKSRITTWDLKGLVQKPARTESNNFPRAIDLASDLIASNLAPLVDAPVVWQVPLVIEGEQPSLFMPVMAEDDIDISNPDVFANGGELSTTLVFEEWVLNTDDKQDHFCAVETELGREFRVIDHGHALLQTLHRHNNGKVNGYDRLNRSVGKNPYPFSRVEHVEDAISRIESISNDQIDLALERSFAELRSLDTNDQDFVEFLEREQHHKYQLQRLLRERRDHIQDIVEDKFN